MARNRLVVRTSRTDPVELVTEFHDRALYLWQSRGFIVKRDGHHLRGNGDLHIGNTRQHACRALDFHNTGWTIHASHPVANLHMTSLRRQRHADASLWPDLVVAALMASLALASAYSVILRAR